MNPQKPSRGLLIALLCIFAVILIWSLIRPRDWFTWLLETPPVFIALALLVATYRRFTFTPLAYVLMCAHAAVLLVGAHYTYEQVPLFNWLRDTFHLARNHYDRLGHLAQGFVPAIIAREILARKTPLRSGWLFTIVIMCCLAISAGYELLEWLAASAFGSDADAFLGTQGDKWDAQKDMALALLGAIASLLTLSRVHDRQLGCRVHTQ